MSNFYLNWIANWSLNKFGNYVGFGGFNGDTSFEFKDAEVTQNGDPTIQNEEKLFVGNNELKNDLDLEQTMTTSSFSKSFATTTSNTVTNGYQVGASVKAGFSIPLIGSSKLTLSTQYHFSTAQTNTETETTTYTASPQNIKVPPHTIAKVTVSLDTLTIRGNVKISGTGFGTLRKVNIGTLALGSDGSFTTKYNNYDIPCAEFLKYQPNDGTPIINNGDETFYLDGTRTYEAAYGSKFVVDVQLVDTRSNEVVKQSSYSIIANS